MTEFLDTNLVLRYLTGVPEDQFRRAQALIDSGTPLTVMAVVLVETAYTLRTQYGLSREQIVDALIEFVRRDNIRIDHLERDVVVEALRLCRPSNRVNFGDAMIWAGLRCTPSSLLHSFDRRFPAESVEIRRP
jgi:predicted nucleic-acid-binding protein